MNDPLYRATMLTCMASVLRLILLDSSRTVEPATQETCTKLCKAMEGMAQDEQQSSSTYGQFAEAVHATYSTVLPPSVMLTDAEKIRSFDRLRTKLYPDGQDPFGTFGIGRRRL